MGGLKNKKRRKDIDAVDQEAIGGKQDEGRDRHIAALEEDRREAMRGGKLRIRKDYKDMPQALSKEEKAKHEKTISDFQAGVSESKGRYSKFKEQEKMFEKKAKTETQGELAKLTKLILEKDKQLLAKDKESEIFKKRAIRKV